MPRQILIGIGAGLAAALFFIIPMKGAMAAGLTMLFAPLPLMIAGLAFSPLSAIGGAAAGAILVAFVVHEYYAIFFLAWAGLPAWWLTRLAWLARPADEGEQASPDGLVWYPAARLVLWAGILGASVSGGLVLVATIWLGGFEAFVAQVSGSMVQLLEAAMKSPSGPRLPQGMTPGDIGNYVALAMPPVLAAWAALAYALNLWIAGRIMHVSGNMKRPWQDIPDALRLPPVALAILAGALIVCAAGGLSRMLGTIVLAAFGTAFALQGYALIHAFSRGNNLRAGMLSMLYTATFLLFPAPAALAALFGLAYALANTSFTDSRPTNPTST